MLIAHVIIGIDAVYINGKFNLGVLEIGLGAFYIALEFFKGTIHFRNDQVGYWKFYGRMHGVYLPGFSGLRLGVDSYEQGQQREEYFFHDFYI